MLTQNCPALASYRTNQRSTPEGAKSMDPKTAPIRDALTILASRNPRVNTFCVAPRDPLLQALSN